MVRFLSAFFIFLCLAVASRAQNRLLEGLKISETAPAELLSTRSLVLYEGSFKPEELSRIQSGFQQIGIDADFYLELEKVLAGVDTERAYSAYFTTREIKFILLLRKSPEGYSFYATEYNNSMSFVTPGQLAWNVSDRKLDEMMVRIYRDSWLREKKQNFLINDLPEFGINVPIVTGRRSELFPFDLKVDQLAVPKMSTAALQAEADTLFKKIYPYPDKIKFVTIPADEKDLTKQGFQYLMIFVRCNGTMAHELLGYDMTKTAATAYGSVTYPNGTPQVKTISADAPVYKVYVKHIRSGNIFLGTKWDADETLVQSMKNYIMGFRTELKMN